MNVLDLFLVGLSQLHANALRSLLTILGITIGVGGGNRSCIDWRGPAAQYCVAVFTGGWCQSGDCSAASNL